MNNPKKLTFLRSCKKNFDGKKHCAFFFTYPEFKNIARAEHCLETCAQIIRKE